MAGRAGMVYKSGGWKPAASSGERQAAPSGDRASVANEYLRSIGVIVPDKSAGWREYEAYNRFLTEPYTLTNAQKRSLRNAAKAKGLKLTFGSRSGYKITYPSGRTSGLTNSRYARIGGFDLHNLALNITRR